MTPLPEQTTPTSFREALAQSQPLATCPLSDTQITVIAMLTLVTTACVVVALALIVG